MDELLRVRGLSKSYGRIKAVSDLSFSIAAGEIHGLLGPNGAGKTTAVKCIVGLLKPDRGTIIIDGLDTFSSPAFKELIGYLPEDPSLPDYLTVREFLSYIGRLRGVSPEEVDQRIDELLELFGIREVDEEFIGSLSKGLKRGSP